MLPAAPPPRPNPTGSQTALSPAPSLAPETPRALARALTSPLALFVVLALLCGCEEFQFEGFLSKSMRIELFNDIPIARISLGGAPPVAAAVDTGSPLVVVDRGSAGSYEERDLSLLEALECTLDCHCTDSTRPLCDSGTGACVKPCSADAQCTDKRRPRCDATMGRCLPGDGKECAADSDCNNPSRPTCGSDKICTSPAKLCQALKNDPSRTRCKEGQCVVFNPRFMFRDLEVHNFEVKPVGLDSTTTLGGLLGAPLLQNFAVRLDYAPSNPSLTLLSGIPDTTEELADDCKHTELESWSTARKQRCLAVMGTPRVGGGLIKFGSTETELRATRLTVPMCLLPLPFNRDLVKTGDSPEKPKHGAAASSGVAAHAVIATGLGTSVIARSAFKRLAAWDPTITEKKGATLHLPYGKETVSIVTLSRVAVVSSETRWLGPCAELALRRRLVVGRKTGLSEVDSAMLADKTFNGASAAILSTAVTFAVLEDNSPLLQGLRNELRPQTPDIGVVLGGSFLKNFVVEIDYPGERTILRCAQRRTPEQCEVLPNCAHPDNSDRTQIYCPLEAAKK